MEGTTATPPRCEVIGCEAIADWQRSATMALFGEEYLCDLHYEELNRRRPLVASHYQRLEADHQPSSAVIN